MVRPPTKTTWVDAYRIGLGLLMIPLGIAILGRSLAEGIVTPPAMLMGLLFIGFGGYRLYVGVVRYRMYRAALVHSDVAASSNKLDRR